MFRLMLAFWTIVYPKLYLHKILRASHALMVYNLFFLFPSYPGNEPENPTEEEEKSEVKCFPACCDLMKMWRLRAGRESGSLMRDYWSYFRLFFIVWNFLCVRVHTGHAGQRCHYLAGSWRPNSDVTDLGGRRD